MNNRAMTLAFFIAAFATYLVWSWVSDVQEKATKRFGLQVFVLKAKKDIRESETINETMIEWAPVPQDFKEPSAVQAVGARDEDDLSSSRKSFAKSGPVALVPIKAGEQITYNKITEPGVRTGLAPQVAPGKRALAIPVNDQSSVSKLIKPGDRVDVITVIDFGGHKLNKVARTVLQDVVVLSVGKNVTNNIPRVMEFEGSKERYRSLNEETGYNTITLEVDPLSAQQLLLLMSSGEGALSLSLRNNDDTERVNLGTTRLNDLVGIDVGAQRGIAGGRQ